MLDTSNFFVPMLAETQNILGVMDDTWAILELEPLIQETLEEDITQTPLLIQFV